MSDFHLEPVAYYYSNYSNNQTFTWEVAPEDSEYAVVNYYTGAVTGLSPGTAMIIGSSSSGTVKYTVQVLPIADGTYYIRNWFSDKYIDISDLTIGNNRPIAQWEFKARSTQRWIFTHVGNGAYTIKSTASTNPYYLGVQGDSTADSIPIVLRTGMPTDGMKWTIDITENGTYRLTPLTGKTNNRVLALEAGNSVANGKTIQQRHCTWDDYDLLDEWLISPVSNEIVLEGQELDQWCWAACARMACSKYMSSQVSQASAAVREKLFVRTLTPTDEQIEESNYRGSSLKMESAIDYILGSADTYSANWSIYSEETLRSLLDAGNVVIITRAWCDDNGESNSSHATLIYDYWFDSENGDYAFGIMDPGPVGIGSIYSRSYAWICNGRNGDFPTDTEDTGVWCDIVVFQIGDYTNTIPWPGLP